MQETINGRIPLYEVDPVQVRQWCGWRGAKATGQLRIGVHCDSLAKGKYVLVGMYMYFNSVSQPALLCSGNYRYVREFAEEYLNGEPEHLAVGGCGVWYVEVWHLVPAPVCDICGKEIHDGKYVKCSMAGGMVTCLDCADKGWDKSVLRVLAHDYDKFDLVRYTNSNWDVLDSGLAPDGQAATLYAFRSHSLNSFVSVMLQGGTFYLPTDWQSAQPKKLDQIFFYSWRPAEYFLTRPELWN